RINSTIDINQDSTRIVFEPSNIKLLEKFWEFELGNSITLTQDDIAFHNFSLFNNGAFLSANGNINKKPEDFLLVEIHELPLDFLKTFSDKDIQGIANGQFAFNGFYDNTG